MRLKVFSQNYSKAFSIMELLVATTIFLIISSIALGSVLGLKNIYTKDVARAKVNQDLRGIFDIIGTQIRQAGERLPDSFPAVLLINETSDDSDILILRRNLLDQVLNLCISITPGSPEANLFFSFGQTDPVLVPTGCLYANNSTNFDSWNNFWLDRGGGTQEAYMHKANDVNKPGEFFTFNDVDITNYTHGNTYRITRSGGGSWTNAYDSGNANIYMLEEWKLSLDRDTGVLKIVENGDEANYLNLANHITDLEVSITMQNGSVVNSFSSTANWKDIKSIDLTVSAQEISGGATIDRVWTSKLFPRSIMSSD